MSFQKFISNYSYVSETWSQAAKAGYEAAIKDAAAIADGWTRPTGFEDLPLDIRDKILRLRPSDQVEDVSSLVQQTNNSIKKG